MKFKIDENLPVELAGLLQAAHHDAETVLTEGLRGESDAALAQVCGAEDRILITLDLGFADIRSYPPDQYPGFVVPRPRWQDKHHIISLFRRAVPLLGSEPLRHRLWVVEETRVRIWPSEEGDR